MKYNEGKKGSFRWKDKIQVELIALGYEQRNAGSWLWKNLSHFKDYM